MVFGISRTHFIPFAFALLIGMPVAVRGQTAPRDEASAIEFFEKKVRPILVENCYNCHSADSGGKGGLRVDDRNGLLAGGDSGPATSWEARTTSLLIKAISYTDDDFEDAAERATFGRAGRGSRRNGLPRAPPGPQCRWRSKSANRTPSTTGLRKEHWSWLPPASSLQSAAACDAALGAQRH